MTSFSVILDNPSKVYFPGSLVSGTLQIVLEKQLTANAVIIELRGEAKTSFLHRETRWVNVDGHSRSDTQYIRYDGNIVYVDESRLLWSSAAGSDHLDAGTYNFPFSFTLPLNCGPSYEGSSGYIRYYCNAKIDVPWKFDKKTMTPFTVMPIYDLNLVPNAAAPLRTETTEKMGIMLFRSGHINLKLSISRTGYVPGECVEVIAEVINASSKPVERIELQLIQIASYTAYRHYCNASGHQQEKRVAFAIEESAVVDAKSTDTVRKLLPIPAVAPSFNHCPLIQVQYEIQAKLFTKGSFGNTIKACLPILIGTVPVRIAPVSMPVPPPMPAANNPIGGNIEPSAPGETPTLNDPPPSYADCVFGKGKMEDDGQSDFSPRYPIYNNVGPNAVYPIVPPS